MILTGMLRNRSRALTKQSPIMPDHQTNSSSPSSPVTHNSTRSISSRFFNGFLLPKNTQSSPTSILDANKLFSTFSTNPFRFGKNPVKPRKIFQNNENPSEKFDSEGIAIVLALIEEQPRCEINTTSRKVLFKSKLKIQIPLIHSSPNGSPDSGCDFGIKTRNYQFSGAPTPTGSGSPRACTGPLSLSEMELSEEYTRVICHGPNPKTTHIYDNCVVESCCGVLIGSTRLNGRDPEPPLEGFLSFCQTCKKNLDDDCDIFMYRGEKAFCSEECRCQEMVLDGLMKL